MGREFFFWVGFSLVVAFNVVFAWLVVWGFEGGVVLFF